jgi:hypothetical protein
MQLKPCIFAPHSVDVTVHVYERHMELLPRPSGSQGDWPNWVFCGWECYINWFKQYVQVGEMPLR